MESLVSDSVGRQTDDDDDGGWQVPRGDEYEEQLELDQQSEPISFVEFTPAAHKDDLHQQHPRRKRSTLKSCQQAA